MYSSQHEWTKKMNQHIGLVIRILWVSVDRLRLGNCVYCSMVFHGIANRPQEPHCFRSVCISAIICIQLACIWECWVRVWLPLRIGVQKGSANTYLYYIYWFICWKNKILSFGMRQVEWSGLWLIIVTFSRALERSSVFAKNRFILLSYPYVYVSMRTTSCIFIWGDDEIL